ncbi:MAG TPA: MarR family transcriptional regulator [Silvibacterium sp.]|nr:MarR family transcriptional regulator [Silvibacterium sp.]
MDTEHQRKAPFAALLLAQIGSHAAKEFADRLSPLKLTPPHAGILRRLALSPGISQRELAAQLRMHASRLVGVIDEMESLGLVVREPSADDRRTYSLQLTAKGRESLAQISTIALQHNDALCAALSPEERTTLVDLLQRIADLQGLAHGVHPGFGSLGSKHARGKSALRSKPNEPDGSH